MILYDDDDCNSQQDNGLQKRIKSPQSRVARLRRETSSSQILSVPLHRSLSVSARGSGRRCGTERVGLARYVWLISLMVGISREDGGRDFQELLWIYG